MASNTPVQKKRGWGRTVQKEKINIVENMDLQTPDKLASIHIKNSAASEGGENTIDLQHPELLSTDSLVNLLTERRVPIPVYENGSASRERLIFLFRKHVVPRPQRKRSQKLIPYEQRIYRNRVDKNQGMEWEGNIRGAVDGSCKSWEGGGDNGTVLGKRKSLADTQEISLSKKSSTEPTSSHATPTLTATPTHPTVVRKLKRPNHSSSEVNVIRKQAKIDNTFSDVL